MGGFGGRFIVVINEADGDSCRGAAGQGEEGAGAARG